MSEVPDHVLRQACQLITRLRSGALGDEQLGEVAKALDGLLPDPHWFGYTIDHEPELSAEEIVKRAFKYEAIQL